jgi:hypothetical protein
LLRAILVLSILLGPLALAETLPCKPDGPSHHVDTTWGYVGYQIIQKPSSITILSEIGVKKLTESPSQKAALGFHQYVELDCVFTDPVTITSVHGVMSYIAWSKGIGMIAEITGDAGDIVTLKIDQPTEGPGSIPVSGVFADGLRTKTLRIQLMDDLKPGLTQSWSLVLPIKPVR